MSASRRPDTPGPAPTAALALRNDPYSRIDDAAAEIWETTAKAIEAGETHLVSDEAVVRLLSAAIKLYVAKTDGEERTFRPLLGRRDEVVTATEVISTTSELLRALRLSPMDLAIWYRVRPGHDPDEPAGSTSKPA